MAPRLKEKYYNELAAKLKDELGIENVNDIPKLEKIVVNMGVGDAATDSKLMDAAVEDLRVITGQQPMISVPRNPSQPSSCVPACRSALRSPCAATACTSSSIASSRLRFPRIRDFRGLSPHSFDGHGNYSMGVTEQIIFPEIDYDKVDRTRGMDITFVTTAKTDNEAQGPSLRFRIPVCGINRP